MSNKTAVVIGASGLVGRQLLKQLSANDDYCEIKTFTRSPLPENLVCEKIQQHVVDFADMAEWSSKIIGTQVFCCIGTTLKKAGSKERQYVIDVDYPSQFLSYAKANGCKAAAVISSIGAGSPKSSFYLGLKAKLERSCVNDGFEHLVIVRPSVLVGERQEFRLGEEIGIVALRALASLPGIKKYRPIDAAQVAKAMLHFINQPSQEQYIFENLELFI